MSKKLCIISHSGGLDSSTLIAKAIAEGYIVQPINFIYGQKNEVETIAQKNVFLEFKEMYNRRILNPMVFDLNTFMEPLITSFKKLRDSGTIETTTELEYYMPFRNLVFGSLCSMVGELLSLATKDFTEVAIGIGVHKHSEAVYKKDYWDITPEFSVKLNEVLQLNDTINVYTYTPYVSEFKEKIIKDAIELEVPYKKTWTCYNPNSLELEDENNVVYTLHKPCLCCEACLEREMQGQNAGVDDINDYSIIAY